MSAPDAAQAALIGYVAAYLASIGFTKTVKSLEKEANAKLGIASIDKADSAFLYNFVDAFVKAEDAPLDSSSSEDESSSSESEADTKKPKSTITTQASSSKSSSDSSSSDSSSDSEAEEVKPLAQTIATAASSSESSSDSESDDDKVVAQTTTVTKTTVVETIPQVNGKKRKAESSTSSSSDSSSSSESSSSDSSSSSSDSSSSDSSSSDSSSDEEEQPAPPPAKKVKVEVKPVVKAPSPTDSSPAAVNGVKNGKKAKEPRPQNVPFRRVKVEEHSVDHRLSSNGYISKLAHGVTSQMSEYGFKAHQDLIVTRGESFRKEKTKKKRGSYRGGEISMASNSIKFED